MRTKGLTWLAVPAAAVACAVVPSVAQASNASIRQAIVQQSRGVVAPLDKFEAGLSSFKADPTKSGALKIAREAGVVEQKLSHAAVVVGSVSASSPLGRNGRRDWVESARHLATAYADLKGEWNDVAKGDAAAAKRKGQAAIRNANASKTLDAKADRDLDLPHGT